jgi:hypothetical protein
VDEVDIEIENEKGEFSNQIDLVMMVDDQVILMELDDVQHKQCHLDL